MVGNMISGAVRNKATVLQIALAVQAGKKSLVETLLVFGVTRTYEELQRFKASVATAAAKSTNSETLLNSVSDAKA